MELGQLLVTQDRPLQPLLPGVEGFGARGTELHLGQLDIEEVMNGLQVIEGERPDL
jgi:hypothetical protein